MPAAMKFKVADVRHAYFRRTLGDESWDAVVSRLTPEERSIVANGDERGMAPALLEGKLMTTLVEVALGNDRLAAERFLRTGGASQADAMLDGIFSVFARFSSPQQALKRAPSIFASVYEGTSCSSGMNPDDRSGILRVGGLGEYTFVAPWLCGWMERALERFGGTSPRVAERAWESGQNGSDDLVFEAGWS